MTIRARDRRRNGFTLIEILLVMAILGMLALMVLPNVVGQAEKARVKTALTQIATLGTALDSFALDVGRYPTTQEGLDALVEPPSGLRMWDGPYTNKKIGLDPWANAYQYEGPEGDRGSYLLLSYGADGRPGGEGRNADISNLD